MTSDKKQTEKKVKPPKGAIRENIEALVIALILALFIRTFFVQAFKIPTGSMLETLQIGDHILVNKFIYGVKLPFIQKTIIPVTDPKREDIVVFIYPEDKSKDFIKRVVGVAGDVIQIKNKKLFVNGKHLTGPYEQHKDSAIISAMYPSPLQNRDNFGPITVPENKLFVMGDNRDNSHDSRFWGFVPLKEVKGKAFIIYWSWDKENFGVRWNRLGNLLK